MRRRILRGALIAIAAVILVGWVTSTRHIEMRFLKEGVPLSGLSLEILGPKGGGEFDVFEIDLEGWVTLPASYAAKKGVCRIKKEDEDVGRFMSLGFRRGETVLNFTSMGLESRHFYRFLFYEDRLRTKEATSEQVGAL